MPKGKKQVQNETMDALYYRHYVEQVSKHGEKTAILLQVGRFFEMYDSVDISSGISRANVQELAEICGSSVDPKPSTEEGKKKIFWGFPESALNKYERILVDASYTVVVIVQNKDATDVVVSRTIDHISSPGTFWDVDGSQAVRKDEQIMLGIYIEPIPIIHSRNQSWQVATSAFDIMTGKIVSTETSITIIDGKPVLDSIQPFWSMYPPAELIVDWCSDSAPPKEYDLRSLFTSFGKRIPIHIRQVQAKEENTVNKDRLRLAFFEQTFKPKTAISIVEFLDIQYYHSVRRSLYQLLQFVNDHNPSFMAGLHSHTIWTPEDNVLLGNAALEQLAMIATHAEKPNESLLHWLQKATTAMGKRMLRERCLKPIADIEELDKRQNRISALRNIDRTAIEQTLKGCADLPRLFRRFQLGKGTSADLLQILITYEKAQILNNMTKGMLYGAEHPESLTIHICSLLSRWDVERLQKTLSDHSSNDSVVLGSVHPWRRDCHSELDRMENIWTNLEMEILGLKRTWEDVLGETDVIEWKLKEDQPFTFTTTARRAASLAAAAKRQLKTDVTNSKRGSSTTVTLDSDALSKANDLGRKIRSEWRNLMEELWRSDWSTWMATEIENGMLELITDFIGRLDAECAFARVSDLYGYVRPTYVESTKEHVAGLMVKELRHPIIERIHTDTSYISHNLAFSSFHDRDFEGASSLAGMLLYGVNAAGKSSLGKAIGLTVLMAQCGIPVPASEMTLIPYTGVFTRILGNDNLWAGMSSFVVEMTEFRSILRSATARTLVIGDELCAGTETASATAIVAAGIQTLAGRSTNFFFATHLHELADIPEIGKDPNVVAYHLTVHPDIENGALIYDRKLRIGCGSAMYGLEVCRGLDMDADFLKRAIDFRKRYFGEDGKPHVSTYNTRVVIQSCEVCRSTDKLETHHIIQQSEADSQNRISPGKHKNARENLVCLCDACHKKHHRGLLEIHGWIQTTDGRKLRIVEKTS